jgi:hypothetical protein
MLVFVAPFVFTITKSFCVSGGDTKVWLSPKVTDFREASFFISDFDLPVNLTKIPPFHT